MQSAGRLAYECVENCDVAVCTTLWFVVRVGRKHQQLGGCVSGREPKKPKRQSQAKYLLYPGSCAMLKEVDECRR